MFEIELIICIKMDLAFNNLHGLICHKTPTTKQPHTRIYIYIYIYIHSFLNSVSFFKYISYPVLSDSVFPYICYRINFQNSFKKQTHLTQASNPWWWPMKGLKVLGTILGNSSPNSNLKLRHLSENLKGSWINYTDKICFHYLMKNA